MWSTGRCVRCFKVFCCRFALEKLTERSILIRARSTTTRDRNLQFRGAISTGFFFSFFSCGLFFAFSLGFLFNKGRKSPQNVEKIARSPRRETSLESCHVSGCHAFLVPI